MQDFCNFFALWQQHAVLISDAPQNDDENHIYKNRRNQRTKADDRIRVCQIPQQRGGKGLKNYNLTAKTGLVAGIAVVDNENDVMIITDDGVVIRTGVEEIRECSRGSQGVIVMRTGADVKVISIARTDKAEEDEMAEESAGESAETTEETTDGE